MTRGLDRSARSALAMATLGLALGACGGSSPRPEPAPPAAAPSAPPSPQPSAAPPAPDADASAAADTEPTVEDPAARDAGAPGPGADSREVRYLMSGGSLQIEVGGLRFKPKAKAIKLGGGWGVRVSLEGEARDDKLHSLSKPKTGPLAFAGRVVRAGKTTELSDRREGDEEAVIALGTPGSFERDWPGKSGEKPLGAGDKLTLEVGLWGIGDDEASRRMLKRFFIIAMVVGKDAPHPVISPPE